MPVRYFASIHVFAPGHVFPAVNAPTPDHLQRCADPVWAHIEQQMETSVDAGGGTLVSDSMARNNCRWSSVLNWMNLCFQWLKASRMSPESLRKHFATVRR